MDKALRIGRRWLYLIHRWVGVATCLLCAMWFISGVVMMYVPYPGVDDDARLQGVGPIDWVKVRITPGDAVAAAKITGSPRSLQLEMFDGEPVYRIVDKAGQHLTISAANGKPVISVSLEKALSIAAHYPGAVDPKFIATIDYDQWSVPQKYTPYRPMYRIGLGDSSETRVYVASATGEIVLSSTRWERVWNWLGSIPHWIYFTPIRADPPLWHNVVVWTSGIAIGGAAAGTWIGVLRIRLSRRYRNNAISPYRGWMEWHHIGGLIGSLFLLTWLFSGWLSMNPSGWFNRSPLTAAQMLRYTGTGEASAFVIPKSTTPASHVRFNWIAGRPIAVLTGTDGSRSVLDGRTSEVANITDTDLLQAAKRLMPDTQLAKWTRLVKEDSYWYTSGDSHGAFSRGDRTLPIFRAEFDDASHAWYHIDPQTGDILGSINDSGRTYRWLFSALHDLDFKFLLTYRPAWDITVIVLSLVGLLISVTGIAISWRRLVIKFGKRPVTETQASRRARALSSAPG